MQSHWLTDPEESCPHTKTFNTDISVFALAVSCFSQQKERKKERKKERRKK